LRARHLARVLERDSAKSDGVARFELSELPKLGRDDRDRAHESAEARTVGPRITGMSPVKSNVPTA